MDGSHGRFPIIAFDHNAWSGPWMNRQELLSRLAARGWPIVYSNGAYSIWDRAGWAGSPLLSGFSESDDVILDRRGRLLLRWPRWRSWDRIALRVHSRRLRGAIGCAANDPMMVQIFEPAFYDYVEALRPTYVAFHVRDYYPGFPGWRAADQRRLDALSEMADLITVAGPEMVDCLPPRSRDRARPLYNAANVRAFAEAVHEPCPRDLNAVPRPRIGVVGTINRKCDLEMVSQISASRPDWQWVFVGHVTNIDRAAWEACLDRPNVHWLGEKEHGAIPRYVAHMNVNALPYRVADPELLWVKYTNPLRLGGYLGTGVPIVGADLPAIRRFAQVVDIATTPREWEAALEHAISHGGVGAPDARRAAVTDLTWDGQVDQLERWLAELLYVAPRLERLDVVTRLGTP